jgi:hypothetical protein
MRMRQGETTCARERERERGVKERERERQKAKEQMKFKETVTHNIRQSALKMKL